MVKKLQKAAVFTDIHWGCKNNSEQHNLDCMNYVQWFCNQAKLHKADHVIFMGDWFENRPAINVTTINHSYLGARLLNELDVPVYFIIGNHDLYHRHTREVYSTMPFNEFSNFVVINEPIIINEIQGDPLLCPYLFHHEYPELVQYLTAKTWWGHFEFKGFVVTGYTITMPTGPDPLDFTGPQIFSGHFHKRQISNNICYIGNTFPTNFGDAGDIDRGMLIYDHTTNKKTFINWEDCPKYIKVTLTDILEDNTKVLINARIKCVVDVPITFEESTFLKQGFVEKFGLREFSMEESGDINDAITDTEVDIDGDVIIAGVDDLVVQMINTIDTPHIENAVLIDIYRGLKG